MHTFLFHFYYLAQLVKKQHLNVDHCPGFPLIFIIRKKKSCFLRECEPGRDASVCFMAYI